MAFDALFTRMSNMLSTNRRISQCLRTNMRKALENEQKFSGETRQEMEQGKTQGDVEGVMNETHHALEELYDEGELVLLESQKKTLTVQLRFQEQVAPAKRELEDLRRHVRRRAPAQEREIIAIIDAAERELDAMNAQQLRLEKKEHDPALEQARELREHGVVDTTWGPGALARFSHYAFRLRKDHAILKEDMDHIDKTIAELERIIDNRHKDTADAIAKADKNLKAAVDALVQHVVKTWKEFVLIMQVLVEYMFLIKEDTKLLHHFLQELEREQFPHVRLVELQRGEARREKRVRDEEGVVLHIITRIAGKQKTAA